MAWPLHWLSDRLPHPLVLHDMYTKHAWQWIVALEEKWVQPSMAAQMAWHFSWL